MRLCDTDIERHLDEGKIVIERGPVLSGSAASASMCCFGNEFLGVSRSYRALYRPRGTSAEMADAIERVMSEEIHVPDGEAFYLHPVSWHWR